MGKTPDRLSEDSRRRADARVAELIRGEIFSADKAAGRVSDASRVADRIRDEIIDGKRPAGSKLVERDLAAELGVSRVPVREALKVLDGEGLVVLRRNTWAMVREFTPHDVEDLEEVRMALEGLAFRLAAQRCDERDLQRLRAVLDAELAAGVAGDEVTSRHAAADFHEVVTEIAGNRLLSELAATMGSRLRWLMGQHDNLVQMTQEHEALYEALAAGDVRKLDRLVRAHIVSSRLAQGEHDRRLRASRRSAGTREVRDRRDIAPA